MATDSDQLQGFEAYRDGCVVILPEGDLPEALLDGLIDALKDGSSVPVLVLGRAKGGTETREVGIKAGLASIGLDIVGRVVDGAATVIRDDYKDNRAARQWYDKQAATYLQDLRRDLYRR